MKKSNQSLIIDHNYNVNVDFNKHLHVSHTIMCKYVQDLDGIK